VFLVLGADRAADELPAEGAQRARPARSLEHGPLGRDETALFVGALEVLLERPDDAHVGVARALPDATLTDLEMRIDAPALGRFRRTSHGRER
jgi:hypothetical protein